MYAKNEFLLIADLNAATPASWKIIAYKETSTQDSSILDYKDKVVVVNQIKQEFPNTIVFYNNTGADLEYLIINSKSEEDFYDTCTTRAEVIAGDILGFVLFPSGMYLKIVDVGAIRAVAIKTIPGDTASSDLRVDFTDYRVNTITRV